MGRNLVETLMGAVVLAVAGYFMVFAYTSTNVRAVRTPPEAGGSITR